MKMGRFENHPIIRVTHNVNFPLKRIVRHWNVVRCRILEWLLVIRARQEHLFNGTHRLVQTIKTLLLPSRLLSKLQMSIPQQ